MLVGSWNEATFKRVLSQAGVPCGVDLRGFVWRFGEPKPSAGQITESDACVALGQ